METAERAESGAGECAHCCRLQPAAPEGPARHGSADSGYRPALPLPHPSSACLSSSSSPLPPSTPPPPLHPTPPGSTLGSDRFCRVWAHVSSARLCSPLRRSGGFWRPWIDPRGKQEEEAPHPAEEVMPGMTEASGKLSRYKHPVRLFWPKSKCYDYLYQEAEALLKTFPIQATISFYEDSDSEDEIEELVPLKQGRSLMDWIRLTKSGKDLTGLKGRLIEVTEEELKKHNKKDDCWICIRGFVYNVSPYMEYHPGGEDELMKAAGSDGTDLFDQVHRWVNYESMLKECLVGRMAVKPAVPKDYHEEKKVLNGMLPKSQVPDALAKEGPVSPSYDWFQTDSLVTIVIYTKQKDVNLDSVIVDHQYDSFRAETIIKDYSYLIHIELSHAIQEDFSVRVVANVGKIEIVLKKKENTSWECLGHPLENHNSLIPKKDTGLYYRKCQLISKEDATHDTKLFCLMLPPSTHLQVPIGQHVYLKLTIAGTEIVKPYTPVSASLLSEFKEPVIPNNKYIYFLIKIYPAGLFTPELDHLQIGDFVSVSNPEGNFKISQFQELEDLFLLAAGTGFTPMVKILNYALTNISSLRKMKLMFFNKTEDDIIWRSQLEKLAFKDKRFDVEFVLSKPTSEWNGKKGHISLDLLSEFLKRSLDKSKVLICICGPMPFTEQGMRMLHDLNFSKDEIHGFTA